jgi:hypothetical protein
MKIDRALHHDVLQRAADMYPFRCMYQSNLHSDPDFFGNLLYLEELRLIDAGIKISLDNNFGFFGFKATAKGLDFLADDGGLSAILGVVTIKLHEDSIKAMLIQKIEGSDAEPTVKSDLVKQVKALPAEGLQTLTTTALQAGLNALPNAVQLLHGWLTNR